MKFAARTTSFLLLVLVGSLASRAEAAGQAAKEREVQVDGWLLSVALDQIPVGEVFRIISEKRKIVVLISQSLVDVPVSEEFEKLPLDEGLRRLIAKLPNENFLMVYHTDLSGERHLRRVHILDSSSPQVQEFPANTLVDNTTTGSKQDLPMLVEEELWPAGNEAQVEKIPKGIQKKMERGLTPGQRKQFERRGELPRSVTHVPEGLRHKMERGEPLPPGAQSKVELGLQYSGAKKARTEPPPQ